MGEWTKPQQQIFDAMLFVSAAQRIKSSGHFGVIKGFHVERKGTDLILLY